MNLKTVKNYALDCILDNIPSCQKHKWACQRFLKDLERAEKGLGPFLYDWESVDKVIRWASFFKHTKGVLAGKHIILHISQVFIIANIYGFYHRDTGYRRFTKLYYQVARKNAKSQLMTIICSYELMVYLNGGMSEVYCAATKRSQARIVYGEVVNILTKCTALKGKWKEAYGKVKHLKSLSMLTALSKEDQKTGDGLNPQCAIIDEYHAHPTSAMLDILSSGMGARPDPLLAIITTAGFDLSYPCYMIEYKMIKQLLDPASDNRLEHYFADIHELEINETSEDINVNGKKIAPGDLIDDPYDEESWKKANPIVCSYEAGIKELRKESKESLLAPEKRRNFFTKHLDVWVNQRNAGYMPLKKWAACKGEIPNLTKLPCYAGLDLSSKIDLAAAGLVFPVEIQKKRKYITLGQAFMPENTFNMHVKEDKTAFYNLWESQGWLEVTAGAVVDYRHVVKWVIAKIAEVGAYIEEFCVDPWGATQISADLIEEGYTVVDIIQGPKTLSEPTKSFREEVYRKNIIHEGNPMISWAIGNAIVESVDRNENIMVSKKKSPQRIDPLASILNGYVRAFAGASSDSWYNRDPNLIRSL